jgi:hypothetical protein
VRTTLLIVAAAAVVAPIALLCSPVRGRRDLLDPTAPSREAVVG